MATSDMREVGDEDGFEFGEGDFGIGVNGQKMKNLR
jgi:hypothetical protein